MSYIIDALMHDPTTVIALLTALMLAPFVYIYHVVTRKKPHKDDLKEHKLGSHKTRFH